MLPTVNASAADASLKLAAKVFVTGLLTEAAAADIGWARVPLSALHGDAARRALQAAGGEVMTRIPVTAVRAGVAGDLEVQANGQVLPADSVVVAVPHDAVGALLPPGTVASQDRLVELGTSPIVNVHLVYDRPVTDLAFFASIGTDAQFVFDRTEGAGLDDGRQCLAVSLSAAETHIGRPAAELVSHFTAELAPPAARRGRRHGHRFDRHPRTFGHLPRGAGHEQPALRDRVRPARCVPGGGLVRHGLAGHDGGRGAQRNRGRAPRGALRVGSGRRERRRLGCLSQEGPAGCETRRATPARVRAMTVPHAHSSGGGSAGRAIVLVIVAVALGALLLARGFDGADDTTVSSNGDDNEQESSGPGGEGDNGDEPAVDEQSTSTTTTTTTTVPPVVTHRPGEVKVAVANGTGEKGRAGRTAGVLNADGYVTAAKNTEQDRVSESVIYYRPGYGDDAKAVASALGAPADLLTPAPSTIMTLIRNPETPQDLENFNIFVVVGTDNVILDPDPVAG